MPKKARFQVGVNATACGFQIMSMPSHCIPRGRSRSFHEPKPSLVGGSG